MDQPSDVCRVAVWNAEWAPPAGVRGRRVADLLAALDADVICLTEGHEDLLPRGGHFACGQPPAEGFAIPGARRVLLWSRTVLTDVDRGGDAGLPHQAFVAARTHTPVGETDVMSVCIPWADADVARFGGKSSRWQQHGEYLEALGGILARRDDDRPLIVAGDFNQYLPRVWGPTRLSALLEKTFAGMTMATRGQIPGLPDPVIDHLAHGPGLRKTDVRGWAGRTDDAKPMSDHSGVVVGLVATE